MSSLSGGDIVRLRPWHVVVLAGLVRVGLICWAEYQDRYLPVKYTDIDYAVFTDASRFVARGESPYRRSTYRYSPLLAYILLPNIQVHPAWGKVLFSASDLAAAGLLSYILRRTSATPHQRAVALALWLFNPYTATISTRGSCDVLSVLLLLGLLVCLLHGRLLASGLLYGLAVHFRIYPVIYGPSIVLYLARRALVQAAGRGMAVAASRAGEAGAREPQPCPPSGGALDSAAPDSAATDGGSRAGASGVALRLTYIRNRRTGAVAGLPTCIGSSTTGGGGGGEGVCAWGVEAGDGSGEGLRGEAAAAVAKSGGGGGGDDDVVVAEQDAAFAPQRAPPCRRYHHRQHYQHYLAAVRPVAVFSLAAAAAFLGLAALFYSLYGKEFVQEAFLHHLTRKDPRHNFSPYYYPIYLSYSDGGDGDGSRSVRHHAGGDGDGGSRSDSATNSTNGVRDVEGDRRAGTWLYGVARGLAAAIRLAAVAAVQEPWRLALLPQAAALLAVALRFHADLPAAWLLQTWCFVALNKVVTAQYFVWYLSLLPLVLPALASQHAVSAGALAAAGGFWVAAQLHWLAWAYQLEMRGRSVYRAVWAAGLVFQVANTVIVVLLARALLRQDRRARDGWGGGCGADSLGTFGGGGGGGGGARGTGGSGEGWGAGDGAAEGMCTPWPPSFLDSSLALSRRQ